MKYKGLPFGMSKSVDDDPLSKMFRQLDDEKTRQTRNLRKMKPKKVKIRHQDSINSVGSQESSSAHATPKGNKTKGMKTRAKDERAKDSSQKPNTPSQRGIIHQAYNTPVWDKFLSPEVIEITRQLSDSDLDIIDELNLSSRNLSTVNYLFSDLQTKNIMAIDISNNNLSHFPECFQLESVRRISLAANQIKSLSLSNTMTNLSTLVLSSNRIQQFPSVECLSHLPMLRQLNLHNNMIRYISRDSLAKIEDIGIVDLNLSSNRLKYLPDSIDVLQSLRRLQLRDNNLISLPTSITSLALASLDVNGNKLTSPPQEVAARGFSAVVRYFQDLQLPTTPHSVTVGPGTAPERYRSCQYKLIVVGHESAGKTSTIRCLTRCIVCVTLPGKGKFYGKLRGMFDDGRYKVQLLGPVEEGPPPHTAPSLGRSCSGNSRGSCQGSAVDEDFDLLLQDDNYDDGEGGDGGGLCGSACRIEACRAEDIELCSPSVGSGWDELQPPDSTIGIDIDTWTPSITYGLLKSKGRGGSLCAGALPLPPGENSSMGHMDGFECFDYSESDSEMHNCRGISVSTGNGAAGHVSGNGRGVNEMGQRSRRKSPPQNLTLSIWYVLCMYRYCCYYKNCYRY